MRNISHLPVLDGLRGVAALMVMVFHFSFAGSAQILFMLEKITVFGQTGVDLFFVLSGFLITRILISTKNSENYFFAFYARRTLRIFPLYYAFLIITFFVLPILQGTEIASLKEQAWYYLYLQNIPMTFGLPTVGPGHFWSLAVEEHFYLLWPLLVYSVKRINNLLIVSIVLIILANLMRLALLKNGYGVFYFTLTRMDSLSIGTILAILEYKKGLRFYKPLFWKMFIILGGALLISWPFLTGQRIDFVQLFKFTVIGMCYFCLIGIVVGNREGNFINKILNGKFLKFSGKISYGLYVFHPLVFILCESYLGINIFVNLIVAFTLTYLLAALSFRLFEQKILNYKKHFNYGKSNALTEI